MNQPKYLGYREWLRQHPELDPDDPDQCLECDRCKGEGEVDCECDDCGHDHKAECSNCDGDGSIFTGIEIYRRQRKIDQERWEKYQKELQTTV